MQIHSLSEWPPSLESLISSLSIPLHTSCLICYMKYMIEFYGLYRASGRQLTSTFTLLLLLENSAKTLNLLAVAHTYQQQGKTVLLLKPELDTRFGADIIQSKAGLQRKADVLIRSETNLLDISPNLRSVDCMLVDEVMYCH